MILMYLKSFNEHMNSEIKLLGTSVSWDELIHMKMPPLTNNDIIGRRFDDYIRYEVHKSCTDYFNIKDNFITTFLFDKHTPHVMEKNKYPYNVEGMMHYLLWINPIYDKFYDDQRIKMIMDSHFGHPYEYRYYKNIPEYMSVFTSRHYHVFVKMD